MKAKLARISLILDGLTGNPNFSGLPAHYATMPIGEQVKAKNEFYASLIRSKSLSR
jgi:hypothetical protein